MFALALNSTVVLKLLETRHSEEYFNLVRTNYERLAVWCPWLAEVDTPKKTERFLSAKLERYANGNGFTAGVFENSKLVGSVALEYIDWRNLTTEIGYWLGSDVEGRGLVTAACRKLIDHAFNDVRLERVQIRCATTNYRSRAIPEKLGFTLEGSIRQCERLSDRTVDLAIYGLLRSEWTSHD